MPRKKRSVEEIQAAEKKAMEQGLTPLEFLLAVMRNANEYAFEARMEAAKAAAPYCHPRLASIEAKGQIHVRHEDFLDQLPDPGGVPQRVGTEAGNYQEEGVQAIIEGAVITADDEHVH